MLPIVLPLETRENSEPVVPNIPLPNLGVKLFLTVLKNCISFMADMKFTPSGNKNDQKRLDFQTGTISILRVFQDSGN